MFHNVLMTSLTPLRNTDEINCWQNRPFSTVWPEEELRLSKPEYPPKSTEVTKTIKKKKRNRTAYSTEQIQILEKTYLRIKYIDAKMRRDLAESLNISEKNIKVWFQNRRMKEKKESSESGSESSLPDQKEDAEMSPPDYSSVSPNQIQESYPEEVLYQQNAVDSTEMSGYQLLNYHFCNNTQIDNVSTIVHHHPEEFTNDQSTYPTYYYPTLSDYYCGENYWYDQGNMNGNDLQWSATNFDLNYFQ